MDIFRFRSPNSPTQLQYGEIVNGLKSKVWVERYRDPGEFTFVAKASTEIRERLPIGSLVSHVDSTEVMIVENHEIPDEKGKDPDIIITGRGFETFLENRIAGSNRPWPTAVEELSLAADTSWNQAVWLLERHLYPEYLLDDNDQIPYLTVMSQVTGSGTSEVRVIKIGNLHTRLMELLDLDNLGVKVVRPGPWSPLGAASPNMAMVLHRGEDRRNQIVFSNGTGEISGADYLWSNKKAKNAALVTGRWVGVMVVPAQVHYYRRVMHVDASDIDDRFSVAPTGSDYDFVIDAMTQRGHEALANQKDVAITKVEVAKDVVKKRYRVDFDLGDLITVLGAYNETTSMRITEFVEIEDENGRSAYPTLIAA